MKKQTNGKSRTLRILLITLLSLIVAGGGIYGILLLIRGNEAVKVYSLDDVGNYSSSGNASTEGIVTTDRVQSVYISDTQQITEIHVKEGQWVSAGDELLTFDTTLTDLELERKEIAVRQIEFDLEKAKKEKEQLSWAHIYNPNPPKDDPILEPGDVGKPRKGLGTPQDPLVILWNQGCIINNTYLSSLMSYAQSEGLNSLYVVFETRQDDSLKGAVVDAWEMILYPHAEGWCFYTIIPDYDSSGDPEDDEEIVDDGLPWYTWNELQRLKTDADKNIQSLELKLAMAKVELETVRHELESGTVKAAIDGVVKTVRDVEDARSNHTPLILVSGGGGYLVTGAMSETELSQMHVGDTVSVLSWQNYESYDGTIVSISEFPDSTGRYFHSSNGNRNVSLYPFTVAISEDSALREGEYVQLTYDPSGEGVSYFLMNPLIRTENGKSYVWAAGKNGLEQRYVTTGTSLWGSYTQILDGLDGVEYVAFPYGNSLREGQKTEISGVDSLYGY